MNVFGIDHVMLFVELETDVWLTTMEKTVTNEG